MDTADDRKSQLSEIKSFIEQADKEITLVLQKFNWDRKHVLQNQEMVFCKYDSNHRIPVSRKDAHEQQCFLTKHGYHKEDKFLPDPPLDSKFMIKFGTQEINKIIDDAARNNPLFKRGVRGSSPEPLTADRLQSTYTSDERRALYDAVVARAPTQHIDDVTDLTLPGSSKPQRVVKSREEVLAELRNMKRRRTKYRVAPKTKNYSDVLRDVIQTQMESYNEAQAQIKIKQEKRDDGYEEDQYSKMHHQVYGHYSNNHHQQDAHHSKESLMRSIPERNDKRKYVKEFTNDRYTKESAKQNEREDHKYDNKDRYRNECDKVIKVEKEEEYKDRRRNNEALNRSKDDKKKAERSYYKDKSEHDKRREKYPNEHHRKNDKDEYKSDKIEFGSHKRHKKDKNKNRERDEKFSYRQDKDSSREKRKRIESISSDRHEMKRKHVKEEYKNESYYKK